ARGVAEEPDDGGADEELTGEDGDDQEGDLAGMGEEECRVDEHTDGDEEEGGEEVAHGYDLVEDVVAVVGLGDYQAGEEGAEGEGNAHRLAEDRCTRGEGHDAEEEKLSGADTGEAIEEGRHQA